MLYVATIAPLIIILILVLVFPLLSDFILMKTGFVLNEYFSIISITIISVIPMLLGMVYAFILLDENDSHILQVISVTPAGRKYFLLIRMLVPTSTQPDYGFSKYSYC